MASSGCSLQPGDFRSRDRPVDVKAADVQILNTAIGAPPAAIAAYQAKRVAVGKLLIKPELNLAVTLQGHRQAAAR